MADTSDVESAEHRFAPNEPQEVSSGAENLPDNPRRRRAGEDDAAIERAVNATRRYGVVRATVNAEPPGATIDEDYDTVFAALADVVLDGFCDWCVVEMVRPRRSRTLARASAKEHDHTGLDERVPDLHAVVELAVAEGRQRYPADVTTGLPWCLVIPLSVHDEVVAGVAFVRDGATPGFGPMESTAADEMVWGAATTIERLDLRRQTERATAAANRVAEHLRSLIDASISLQATSADALATETVERARELFDAETAVLIDDGPPPRVLRADRGTNPVDLATVPRDDTRDGAWFEAGWLVATVRDPSGNARGRLAIHRTSPIHDEDVEILTLLAQTAAITMTAAELTATIRASEARWRVLVDSAPVGIIEVDDDERVRWWNRSAATIFSWPAPTDDAETPPLPPAVLAELRPLWAEVASGELPGACELRAVTVGGRPRDLSVSARRLETGDGTPATTLTLVDDITDRRQMREELRHAHTMEIRGLVAGSAVHDFNNLLTIISGYGELLVEELPAGPAREAATAIVATSGRASALTGQLQTIGRTQHPDPVVVNPATVLESNAEVIERILGEAIRLTWSVPTEPAFVRVDADQFEQTLLNLVINARDAMPAGGELLISLNRVDGSELDGEHRVERSGTYAVLTVTDTGTGMDEATLARCFDPLFTTKGPFSGTGLGLAAARRLMEESGGSIIARSRLGAGSTFELALPLVDEPDHVEPAMAPVVPTPSANTFHGATVLVAEDDEALRRLMVQVLRRNGYHVLEAASGEAALHLLDDAVDLLVSDVVMGALSGVDLATRVPVSPSAPAILLVSGTADPSIVEGLGPRTCDFLAKPFRPSQFVERVIGLLVRRAGASR